MATPEQLGEIGGYYFAREVDWLRRHVQHLSFPDSQSVWQQLTIDVALPHEDARIDRHRRAADGMVFCMPVARLEKAWPLHKLDFVDESGRVLPLLTMDVHARITAAALKKALTDAGVAGTALTITLSTVGPGGVINAEEHDVIQELVRLDAISATSYREVAYILIATLPQPGRERFQHLIADLTKTTYIWTVLVGDPGEQRTIKLSYDIELPRNATIHRIPGSPTSVPSDRGLPVSVVLPGYIDVDKTTASMLEEGMAAFGLTTRSFRVPALAVAHVDSYHLAFTAPEGVVVHEMAAQLTTEQGTRATPQVSCRGQRATLYHRGPVLSRGEAVAALRPDLRGLGIAAIYAAATALLLWIVHDSAPLPQADDDAVAAVVLVIPIFLAVFARRRSEHALVGALLSGVRLLMLVVAALAVTAGAAVAGLHLWLSTRHTTEVCAIGASAAAGVVLVAWARWAASAAHRWWQRARRRERRPG